MFYLKNDNNQTAKVHSFLKKKKNLWKNCRGIQFLLDFFREEKFPWDSKENTIIPENSYFLKMSININMRTIYIPTQN